MNRFINDSPLQVQLELYSKKRKYCQGMYEPRESKGVYKDCEKAQKILGRPQLMWELHVETSY